MPVITLPTMNAFMEGAAAVRAEPIANSNLAKSRMFLLLKHTSNFPLSGMVCDVFSNVGRTRLTTVGTYRPCLRSR